MRCSGRLRVLRKKQYQHVLLSIRRSLQPLLLCVALLSPVAAAAQQAEQLPFPGAAPESMGFSAAKLDQAQRQVETYVDKHKLAGVVTLVARKGRIVHAKAYGMRSIEQERPMTFNTIFRLASMTKPITSVALMMLVEEGRVELEDPVSTYIPAFAETQVFVQHGSFVPLERPILIKDVLMHTSGLTAGRFSQGDLQTLYRDSDLGEATTLAAFVDRLTKLPLAHQPGAGWSYGYSTDVAACIVEVVSDMPFDQFVQARILKPLKMDDTYFAVPEDKLDRVASVYAATEEGLQYVEAPTRVAFPRGVGGMLSTLPDYLRFAQMLLNGGSLDGTRLLQPETVALMTRNHLPDALLPIGVVGLYMPNNGFGLGVSVVVDDQPAKPDAHGFWWNAGGAPPVGAYWWVGAWQTYFWVDPAHEIIGLLMTQSPDLLPYAYKQEFHTMVYEAFDDDAPSKHETSTRRK